MCKYLHYQGSKRRPRKTRALFKRRGHAKRRSIRSRKPLKKCINTVSIMYSQNNSGDEVISQLCFKRRPVKNEMDYEQNYTKITHEMMMTSLRVLSRWQYFIPFSNIFNYIKCHYPVNPDSIMLDKELRERLYIAEQIGIVTSDELDRWRLNASLDRLRQTPDTLV